MEGNTSSLKIRWSGETRKLAYKVSLQGTAKWRNKMKKQHSIPTGNAQLVYGINGITGEVFMVNREGTMLPKGCYQVVSKGKDLSFGRSNYSTLLVEEIKEGDKVKH